MNNAYMSAIAALAGSAVGALASLATTWLTLPSHERADRFAQAITRREHLYGEFIEEASKLFADALTPSARRAIKVRPPLRAGREFAALRLC